jgi:cystathionine gamma-synthase
MKSSLETIAARVGTEPDLESRALSPSIQMATTYARDDQGEHSAGFIYSRLGNPTRQKLESALSELEGGTQALAFASGMAAANAILQSLKPGDRILLPHDIYYGVRALATDYFGSWGLVVDSVDMTDLKMVRDALKKPTRLVWLESPSNPQVSITDIAAVSLEAKKAGATVVVDNTWCTPLITRPIEFGADVVMHSITKYFGGHSDVLGGALVFAKEDMLSERVHSIQQKAGAVLDPFSCWLTLRGIRSMAVRLERQCESAQALAEFLFRHPSIEKVHYPGLPTDPGHEIASRQMKRFGGMLSILVKGSAEQAKALASNLHYFANATSLGGTESLIEHRASIEGPGSTTPDNLLRISVGLESVEDLKSDLDRGLKKIAG